MKKENFLREQTINRIHEKSGINTVSGTDLIVVDIQPEYSEYMGFKPYEFTEFLNKGYDTLNSLTFLLCGGGINECLKEVEIAIKAMDKNYRVLTNYTY